MSFYSMIYDINPHKKRLVLNDSDFFLREREKVCYLTTPLSVKLT